MDAMRSEALAAARQVKRENVVTLMKMANVVATGVGYKISGDAQTGVCIMQMDAGLDTGPVFLERAVPIRPDDTASSLREHLAQIGAEGPGMGTTVTPADMARLTRR